MTVQIKVLIIFMAVTINWINASGEDVAKSEKDRHPANKTSNGAPVSVDSRFFDLGQLFGPLFSNFNQNRPAGNLGNNFPQNQSPQFQPSSQDNLPQRPNPENTWGNPNQGSFNPSINQGFNPQRPDGPNQWQNPQFSNPEVTTNYPNNFYPQMPNQQIPNGPNQWQNPQTQGIQNPTYPNDPNYQYPGNNQNPNWRPENAEQGPNQFPNPGVSNGLPPQIQRPNQGQDWNQERPTPDPDQYRPIQYPDQDNQRPNNAFENYPSNNNQYPEQDVNQGWQNNNSGGTLDDISPPTNYSSGNAILGKPVVVPTTTVDPNKIFFNNSSESPLQRQCVQDCPATPEYNPICGTNNVTYFNPGKFVCARNCGVSVYVARRGVCRRRPM